ncbi:MAG: DUF2963 domain-containing protein [Candidatus Phytoplasma sp. TWB_XP]
MKTILLIKNSGDKNTPKTEEKTGNNKTSKEQEEKQHHSDEETLKVVIEFESSTGKEAKQTVYQSDGKTLDYIIEYDLTTEKEKQQFLYKNDDKVDWLSDKTWQKTYEKNSEDKELEKTSKPYSLKLDELFDENTELSIFLMNLQNDQKLNQELQKSLNCYDFDFTNEVTATLLEDKNKAKITAKNESKKIKGEIVIQRKEPLNEFLPNVKGYDNVKQELKTIFDFINNSARYQLYGA